MANVKIYKCLPNIFALALTVFELQKFKKNLPSKVGQRYEVQFSQLRRSMANVKICKSLSHIVARALTVLDI